MIPICRLVIRLSFGLSLDGQIGTSTPDSRPGREATAPMRGPMAAGTLPPTEGAHRQWQWRRTPRVDLARPGRTRAPLPVAVIRLGGVGIVPLTGGRLRLAARPRPMLNRARLKAMAT